MITPKQVHALMTEIGPVLELDEVTESIDEEGEGPVWVLRRDDTIVEVDFEPDTGRLTLQTDIGAVPAERRMAIFEAMLKFNDLWHATGGYRLSLRSEDEIVSLIVDVPTNELDITRLAAVVSDCGAKAQIWSHMLTSDQAHSETAPERDQEDPFGLGLGLRI